MLPPLSLIGLPYQFGRRDDGKGYRMAGGPDVLLGPHAVPDAVAAAGWDFELMMLDDLDDAVRPHADGVPASPGDQMVRQQIQNAGLGAAVRAARDAGRLPVCFSGGCNSSIGMVSGLSPVDLGMFWFDAHADAETPETSPDGLFEGMPVSVIAGECWTRWASRIEGFTTVQPEKIAQIGLHDQAFRTGPVHRGGVGFLVDPAAVQALGFEEAFSRAADSIAARAKVAYVHIDTDVIDPAYVRASLHTAPGGPSPDQLIWAVGEIADRMEIGALNFTCFDIAVDPNAPRVLTDLVAGILGELAR